MEIKLATAHKSDVALYEIINNANKDNLPDYLSFLQPNTVSLLKNTYFNNGFHPGEDVALTELKKQWKAVLVDAIFFLKINDYREASFFDKTKGERKKTVMSTPGVSDIAESSVYGIKELSNYFEQFTKFESTLYGVDKYYRDHVIHPINVWLTGVNILATYGYKFSISSCNNVIVEPAKHADPKWFGTAVASPKISTAEISAMWAVIALTHDIGYPLEKVDKINDQLEAMLYQFGNIGFDKSHFSFGNQHDHLVKFLLKIISSVTKPYINFDYYFSGEWVNHLRTKYYTKFSKSWEKFDHGIVSSLLLLKTLTFFIESDYSDEKIKLLDREDARQFAIRSEMLHAIASHTTPKIYHLAISNLSFLLVFCDDIQEWSRPTLADIRAGLRGNAKDVEINKFIIAENADQNTEIECSIQYESQEYHDQARFVLRVFQQWFERLRPALDDINRSFCYKWNIKFSNSATWSFIFDNKESDNFKKIKISGVKDKDNLLENKEFSLKDLEEICKKNEL